MSYIESCIGDSGCEQVYSTQWPDFSTSLRFARNDNEMDPGTPPKVFDNCREFSTNRPFYAKQSQFPKKSSERKAISNNEL